MDLSLAALCLMHDALFEPAAGQHDELVGGHDELLGKGIALGHRCKLKQRSHAPAFGREYFRHVEVDAVPSMRRCHECRRRRALCQRCREISRAVSAFERRIAAVALDAIEELDFVAVLGHERARQSAHRHA